MDDVALAPEAPSATTIARGDTVVPHLGTGLALTNPTTIATMRAIIATEVTVAIRVGWHGRRTETTGGQRLRLDTSTQGTAAIAIPKASLYGTWSKCAARDVQGSANLMQWTLIVRSDT